MRQFSITKALGGFISNTVEDEESSEISIHPNLKSAYRECDIFFEVNPTDDIAAGFPDQVLAKDVVKDGVTKREWVGASLPSDAGTVPEYSHVVRVSKDDPNIDIIMKADDPNDPDYVKGWDQPSDPAGDGFVWIRKVTICGPIWIRTLRL